MQEVKISHAGRAGLHPYYRDFITQLPEGYTSRQEESKSYWKKSGMDRAGLLSRVARFAVNLLGLPNMWRVKTKADIVYCCQHLPFTKKPWILDVDHPAALVRYNYRLQYSFLARMLVNRATGKKKCRAVVFWSEAAKDAYTNAFHPPSEVREKMFVLYPSAVQEKRRKTPGQRFFFVANMFHQKGGLETLEAFKRYHGKHPKSTLTVVADVDHDLKQEYKNCGITFKKRIPREKLFEEFRKADVFLYPTKMDIFGLVILEALSVGLSVVTTDDFCTSEMVEDGKNGIIVKRSIRNWFDSCGLMSMNCDYGSPDYTRLMMNTDEKLVQSLVANMGRALKLEGRLKEKFLPGERKKILKRILGGNI